MVYPLAKTKGATVAPQSSHVLAAMGALTQGNVRITLPLDAVVPDREAAVERLVTELGAVVRQCRERIAAGH